jgi:predicted lipoprotein with Yx(FWY)xxD motif
MKIRWLAVALSVFLVSGCAQTSVPAAGEGSVAASPTAAAADARPGQQPESPSATPSESGTKIVAADSHVGTILLDATGQAIYIFDVERTNQPRCYDACANAWPPVLTNSVPQAGQGATGSLLGTTQRAEGTTQVTYAGHPLYFYAHEGKHEVKCHDVFSNGGNWYAIQPDGSRAP